ncbi:hypothetical protein FCG67_05240 [Rhodococcus oryzae]|uniref:Ig-like domain repeat protein n=1 Tax=Rhodococcus oryzae TaxID=2571143 RepID=A0ABY2RPC5_9NOCA|nr:hypothetical protein [Rhodococcus oryzae]TJZ80271.1 hypothetical protein FCG67_05240 [Rhodococcus oryzae]
MRTSRKSIARAGAVTGLAAIALLANPALGSAAVAGSAAVHVEGKSVVVEFTGVSSPTLLVCSGQVKDLSGQWVAGDPAPLSGNPASGTYKSPALKDGTYRVEAVCFDAGGFTFLTPAGGEEVTIGDGSGSSGINLGSVQLTTGS